MKILQVNKFLYRRAGAEAYMLDLAQLLVEHGHEVMLWGTRANISNISKYTIHNTRYKILHDFLVEPLNYNQQEGLEKSWQKFKTMLWSSEAAKKFEKVLTSFKPDVVQIHNIYHHLSPSILAVAKKHRVPVVQTVHDYKWICPNYKLYTQGTVCERCRRYRYWNALTHKCVQNSMVASGAAACEMWYHRLLQVYEKDIARFITPSDFLRDLLIKWGKDANKIVKLHNFVQIKNLKFKIKNFDDFILFSGRLSEEKGIYLLLQIAKALPEIKFKIAGDIKNFPPKADAPRAQKFKIENLKNIEWLDFQEKKELDVLISQARMVIVPSLWYENYPMSVLEAQAVGKAVVASSSGGISEMIEDGETGFLISPTKCELKREYTNSYIRKDSYFVGLWVDKIKKIYHNETLLRKVGEAARKRVLEENNPEEHYSKMMGVYKEVSKIKN